jgi:hypothetical protein
MLCDIDAEIKRKKPYDVACEAIENAIEDGVEKKFVSSEIGE